ncbi:TetR/AcrR family transcriptional regulator [Streptomyces sp. AS02]|uniref:TetR/AcrR family transcriptional regulator n=1 Tax=Streptomyces sp. AS02 TaxID=2938946 RepID=UPI002020E9C0|nr:TetR family transcriptional regulator [Streptomyces sp. AS02]MCL8014939.1 TetR family transcriptional regulator [Streptomyces sp. AS02]
MPGENRAVRERGKVRRQLLLDAVIQVISEKGISGVTHRAVAATAGVPTSSATYFFDSLDHMIAEAVGAAMDQEVERLRQLQDIVSRDDAPASRMVDHFIEHLRTSPDDHTVAQFEMYLFASRRPELQARVADIVHATKDVAASALRLRGITDSAASATVVALIDGFALHRIAVPAPEQLVSLHRALRALTIGFVALESAEAGPPDAL